VYGYDPKKAAALLDEAGWKMSPSGVRQKNGQPLTLGTYYRSDNYDWTTMATFCKSMYQPLGIDIELHGLAQAGYFDAVRSGKHHLQYWWQPWPDPDVVRSLFHSAEADGGRNRNRYKNAEMDKLIDDAAGTVSVAKRRALYAQIQMKALREAIMVYFTDSANLFAYQKSSVMGAMLDWRGQDLLFNDMWLKK
jgi:ABC-type transport system substrate-binding protein